jgi:hypothetical protein
MLLIEKFERGLSDRFERASPRGQLECDPRLPELDPHDVHSHLPGRGLGSPDVGNAEKWVVDKFGAPAAQRP